jgi:hypothetical protein
MSKIRDRDNVSNVTPDNQLFGPSTQRIPGTEMRDKRRKTDIDAANPWTKPNKAVDEFNDLNDSYTADFRKPTEKSAKREPICVLKVELDGDHTEKIKVYEGEDPELIVQRFGIQFNLSENAMNRLLK